MVESLRVTLRFLTRLPIPGPPDLSDPPRVHLAWFPFAGFLVGIVLGLGDAFLTELDWPIRNAIVLFGGVLLSGALHLDALMDTGDALSTRSDNGRDLMHASVHTATGAVLGLTALALTWLALCSLQSSFRKIGRAHV